MKRATVIIMVMALVAVTFCSNAFALTFTVQRGDNFWKFSKRFHEDWYELQRVNKSRLKSHNPNLIYPGEIFLHTDAYDVQKKQQRMNPAKQGEAESTPVNTQKQEAPVAQATFSPQPIERSGVLKPAIGSESKPNSKEAVEPNTNAVAVLKSTDQGKSVDADKIHGNLQSAKGAKKPEALTENRQEDVSFVRMAKEMPRRYVAAACAVVFALLIWGFVLIWRSFSNWWFKIRKSVFILSKKGELWYACIDYSGNIRCNAPSLHRLVAGFLKEYNPDDMPGGIRTRLTRNMRLKKRLRIFLAETLRIKHFERYVQYEDLSGMEESILWLLIKQYCSDKRYDFNLDEDFQPSNPEDFAEKKVEPIQSAEFQRKVEPKRDDQLPSSNIRAWF